MYFLHAYKKQICAYMLCCLPPTGGVPCQAEESVDRGGPCVVSSSLQSAQPAAEGETSRAGKHPQCSTSQRV